MKDFGIHIFDKEECKDSSKLCNIMGATITDEIIPFFTTHIITNKVTPFL
jgi:hypothetical protein